MSIILFDGECQLCDYSVQFIIKRDLNRHFKFASLQSDKGKKLLAQANAPQSIDSLTVITDGKYLRKSSAALFICKKLTGWWRFLYFFKIIPKPIRDRLYEVIASHRIKWFGEKTNCLLPSPEERSRFLNH